jgi:histidyl-tRNA synthetase
MNIIQAKPISGFLEKLPEEQIIEDNFKDIIKKNYLKSGFVSIETPVIEREEILTSK